jgi:hypothetical protein
MKHYKTTKFGESGYYVPEKTTNIIKDYLEHKLKQGTVLIPPNLAIINRMALYRIIREQAELIKRLKQGES